MYLNGHQLILENYYNFKNMTRTISDLEVDLARKLHGTNLNQVQGLYSLIDEGARSVLADLDFYETKRIQQIDNAIYANVYDYPLPTDLKGDRIIDIRPQINRTVDQIPQQTYNMEFDQRKEYQRFTIQDNSNVRTLRFNSGITPQTLINQANSITDNGTWSVGDDGTNLTEDKLNFISGGASLNFDVTGVGTTVSIENTTFSAVDLTDFENTGAIFIWVYMPVVVTNITLRWGDDTTTNYWETTVTTPQNNEFVVGWNLVRFDWNGATTVGTPTVGSVNALKVSMTYDGNADTDYRINNVVISNGSIWEILYYSKYLFKNSSGTWIEEVDNSNDTIVLDGEGYNCLLYKVLELVAPQIQAEDANFDLNLYTRKYDESRTRYRKKYRPEVRPPKTFYYRRTKRV